MGSVESDELNHDGGGDRQELTDEQVDVLGRNFRIDLEHELERRKFLASDDAVMDALIKFMQAKSVTSAEALSNQLMDSTDQYVRDNW